MQSHRFLTLLTTLLILLSHPSHGLNQAQAAPPNHPKQYLPTKNADHDKKIVQSQHAQINNAKEKTANHTRHPGAQWFPDAGMGLFLHWSICSVKAMNISHPMIPGRPLEKKKIHSLKEIKRIVRQQDYNLNGKKPVITPRKYWEMAKTFNPDNYHPEIWLQKVKDAGFTYVVLTAKHHDGFAMWPSDYGNFNTKNYMQGKDLIDKFVKACHKVGLKVGIYYSGPDWHFHRNYMTFLRSRARKLNPQLPILDIDLLPHTFNHSKKEIKKHQKAFAKMVKGQVDELLKNYGKIDVLWFDGRPPIPNAKKIVTKKYIYKLQPQIVINPRMHGNGDYRTFERHLPDNPKLKKDEWAEFCNPWNGNWPYVKRKYKPLNSILKDLTKSRSLGINYLLGIGPMGNGDLAPQAYQEMEKLKKWIAINRQAIYQVRPLNTKEKASVHATQHKNKRYLYLPTTFKPQQQQIKITLLGTAKPTSVTLLKDRKPLPFTYQKNKLTITVPLQRLSQYLGVIKVTLPK